MTQKKLGNLLENIVMDNSERYIGILYNYFELFQEKKEKKHHRFLTTGVGDKMSLYVISSVATIPA